MIILSIAFIIQTTLMYSTPLLFTSLGGTLSENGGVVNIGLEGMMTIGAFTGAAVGYYTGNAWIGFLAAGAAGGLLAVFHAIACVTFKADHVVSGIAINFLGPGLALFLSRIFFNGATQTLPVPHKVIKPIDGLFTQNSFFEIVFNQYGTVYLAFIMVAVVWFFLYKTKLGLRLRSVGEHPKAADTLGIHVFRMRYFGVIASGVFAGFGGASLSVAIVSQFRPTLVAGQGFIALAAMIFGKWKPQGAMAACLLFGFAQAIAIFMGRGEIQAVFPISSQLTAMFPYLLTLIILVGFVGKSVAPSADGIPYEKGSE